MKYRNASSKTFKRRQIFSIQVIGDKITLLATRFDGTRVICIEIRSAVVPADWEDRLNWIKVFELLVKLKVKPKTKDRHHQSHCHCCTLGDVPGARYDHESVAKRACWSRDSQQRRSSQAIVLSLPLPTLILFCIYTLYISLLGFLHRTSCMCIIDKMHYASICMSKYIRPAPSCPVLT